MSFDEPVHTCSQTVVSRGGGVRWVEEGETETFGGDSADLDQTQQQ